MTLQKFKAVIVDDEHDAREIIAFLLEEMFPVIEVVCKADSVSEAVRAYMLHKPDIVFLDVELGDGTGFDFLSRVPELKSLVVFITAYDKYAINAIKASAFDYILKPVSKGEFRQSINKVMSRLEHALLLDETNALLPYHNPDVRKIGIPNLTGLDFVDVDAVLRCEADGNYTTVYFGTGQKVLVSRSLSNFENDLKRFGFFRVHHKHLVNLNNIQTYRKGKGGGYVSMSDGVELEVSVRKKTDLLNLLSMSKY